MYLMMRTNEPKSWGKNVPTTIKLSGRSQQAGVMTLKKEAFFISYLSFLSSLVMPKPPGIFF